MNGDRSEPIRIALPSKGHLYDGSIALFRSAGYTIRRPSERQYEASISGYPEFHVVFMRPADIAAQVRDGRCHLGVTGFDVYAEHRAEGDESVVVTESLGFGGCRLSVAVPESWIDVTHILDLVDLTTQFKANGKTFRVSTKYPHLTRAAFRKWGIFYYQVIPSDGALELHPSLGIADIIVDLTSSGATLKDNRLKEIEQGTVLDSAACLIGYAPTLRSLLASPNGSMERLLDALDAVRAAVGWLQIDVNGASTPPHAADIAGARALEALQHAGAQHLILSSGCDSGGKPCWRITGRARASSLVACRRVLADIGAQSVAATPVALLFDHAAPSTAAQLRQALS